MSDVNTRNSLGGKGGYVTVDLDNNGAINISAKDLSDVNQCLQPYQAIFVVSDVPTPSDIIFEESDKSVDEPQTDVFSSSQPHIFVNLFDQESFGNQSTADDGLVIYFSPGANNEADIKDALKFINADETIARSENGKLISYENRAMPEEEDVLQLFTNQYRTSDYTMEVGVQFLPEHTAYLYDSYTEVETLLENNTGNLYSFSVDPSNPESIATDRFEIRFQTSTLGTDEFELEGISVYPNPTNTILNINLNNNIGRFDTLELFDISGRLVAKQSLDNELQESQLNVSTFSSGVYLLKVSSASEQFSTKVIVK